MKLEELELAYKIAAKVVALYGDAYLPIFEQLHKERMEFREKLDVKALAISVASRYNGE